MNKYDWFFLQPVSEAEMQDAFDAVETSINNLSVDQGNTGIYTGLAASVTTPTNTLSVNISVGVAYDQQGNRVAVPALVQDISVDSNAVPTTVAGSGNEKWVTVFAEYTRAVGDPRVDGNGATIQYDDFDGYSIVVVQGTEAAVGTATRPSVSSSMVLLFDIYRYHGQTAITTAVVNGNNQIDATRRQDVYNIAQSPFSIRGGTMAAGLTSMLTDLNSHVNSVGLAHPDSAISTAAYSGTHYSLPGSTSISVATQIGGFGGLAPAIDALTGITNGQDYGLRLYQLSDVAALRSFIPYSSCADGLIAGVDSIGVYTYMYSQTGTDDGLSFIKASGTGGNPGGWVLSGGAQSLASNVGNGNATLSAGGRLPAVNQQYGIIYDSYAVAGSLTSFNVSTTPGDTAVHNVGPFVTISSPALLTTDIVEVSMTITASSSGGGGFSLSWTDGASGTTQVTHPSIPINAIASPIPFFFRARITPVAGTNAIGFCYQADDSSSSVFVHFEDLTIRVLRAAA